MNLSVLTKETISDEGIKKIVYKCTSGKDTIGIGRNLTDRGLTKAERKYLNYYETSYENLVLSMEQIMYLFENDTRVNISDLKKVFPDFDSMQEELQHVLFNLMHQLGYTRFVKFKNTISAIKQKDWKLAGRELRDSAMWRNPKTKGRTERNAKRIEALK